MLYEMMRYADGKHFNDDARRRNEQVKHSTTPLGPHLWWKVEQVIPLAGGEYDVLWSRPEPLKTR